MSVVPAASINLKSRIVTANDGSGAVQEILYTVDRFIVHADLRGAQWGYNVTAPCGRALGRYRLKSLARCAARAMAPLVTNWEGDDLNTIFGNEQTARDAYNAALIFMKG